MFYKNNLLILLILSMFTFTEKVDAKYEKLFFDHSIKNINNETIDLNQYKGKTILLVNVASKCGFTKQYTGLQDLYEKYKDRGFYVIGVPSNQFGGQEPGSHEEICRFTSETFGVDFPLMSKMDVKGENQSALYEALTKIAGVDGHQGSVRWNFEKFLIDYEGNLTRYPSQTSVVDII